MQSIYLNKRLEINPLALFAKLGRIAVRWKLNVSNGLVNLFRQIQKPDFLHPVAMLKSKNQVAILYFGRTSEFLLVTSERKVIPQEGCTLAYLLEALRLRGGRWGDELANSHVFCCIDGKPARLTDRVMVGSEVEISSRKSVFEV